MLKSLFAWLDAHPGSYWLGAGVVTLLLLTRVWTAVRQNSPAAHACSWRSRAWDALVLFLFVLGWRWPFLLAASDYNPDESQLIAGAITLAQDPVFWRSVDGTTSGPLNFYVLLPWHWLGLPLDYFTARLGALLMIGVALFGCHRALTRSFGRAPAWLGLLAVAGFFATATHVDLVHYSSEHVTIMLLGVCFWALAARTPPERLRLWLGCGLAGLAPWAKLQAAPISAALVGWALWQEWRDPAASTAQRLRRAGPVVLAAALPSLVATVLIVATGQFETALRRYFFQNIVYVQAARTLSRSLQEMLRLAEVDGRVPWLLSIGATTVLATGGYYALRRRRPPELFIAAGVVTAAAVVAVVTPRREFLHYCLLLPIPLTMWLGAGLGGWWVNLTTARARILFSGIAVLVTLFPLVLTRSLQPRPEMFGHLLDDWRHPRIGSSLVIRELAAPGDALAIWGWANNLYVESGLRQATRSSHSVWCIDASPQRDYHRAEFMEQMRGLRPAVFVDAVGPGAFAYDVRRQAAHETFPELRDYVARHYTLVADFGSARIYGRNDLATLPRLTPARVDELISHGRLQDRLSLPKPPVTPLDGWPKRFIDHREVLMLLPPAEISWLLDADVRTIGLEFGFEPEAYERGQSNGAEIIVELSEGDRARVVFRRLLDPARKMSDRGPQTATVVLPPFGPQTRLIVRSTPGENNDNAWDWLYLASISFQHSPHFIPAQFPQFTRVPDFAEVGPAVIQPRAGNDLLSLDAPSMVGYVLHGGERRLRFDYGIHAGAYTNGGHTDGAVFRVERERAGQGTAVLFERLLDPQSREADRGAQHADLDLTGCAAGDRLILRIDPGPAHNNAWDWTFLDRVELTGP
ncbi:MAG TPA: hypothetical protein VFJ90_08645 [Candidatus Didemnitutus sp.]|nr:hypothetical protein [Candidatus Didemnitutus sp.]